MKSLPKAKLSQVGVGLNIAQNHFSSPYDVISGHYLPPFTFTKSEIRLSWSRFEHCSESLVYPIGSHVWSLFAAIHMTVDQMWNYVKL